MKLSTFLATWVVVMSAACGGESAMTGAERAVIIGSVDSATRAFLAAELARDPGRILAHIAPDFYMYNDGGRAEYAVIASQIREMFPTLQRFESVWEDIEVTPLGRNHALVSLTFRDRVVDASGNVLRVRGPTTLVWERRADGWLIIYADADHYPDSSAWPDPLPTDSLNVP